MRELIWFKGCATRDEAATRLKELSKKHHPDVSEDGDNGSNMAAINEEYSFLKLKFRRQDENRAKKQEIFEWVREKSLNGIEKNNDDIKNATIEGIGKLLTNIIPNDKKHLRKIAIGLLTDELENFDLMEFGRNIFEQVGKTLKFKK